MENYLAKIDYFLSEIPSDDKVEFFRMLARCRPSHEGTKVEKNLNLFFRNTETAEKTLRVISCANIRGFVLIDVEGVSLDTAYQIQKRGLNIALVVDSCLNFDALKYLPRESKVFYNVANGRFESTLKVLYDLVGYDNVEFYVSEPEDFDVSDYISALREVLDSDEKNPLFYKMAGHFHNIDGVSLAREIGLGDGEFEKSISRLSINECQIIQGEMPKQIIPDSKTGLKVCYAHVGENTDPDGLASYLTSGGFDRVIFKNDSNPNYYETVLWVLENIGLSKENTFIEVLQDQPPSLNHIGRIFECAIPIVRFTTLDVGKIASDLDGCLKDLFNGNVRAIPAIDGNMEIGDVVDFINRFIEMKIRTYISFGNLIPLILLNTFKPNHMEHVASAVNYAVQREVEEVKKSLLVYGSLPTITYNNLRHLDEFYSCGFEKVIVVDGQGNLERDCTRAYQELAYALRLNNTILGVCGLIYG